MKLLNKIFLVSSVFVASVTLLQHGSAQTNITLDAARAGRAFEGFGSVSGGGNTSRLLPDYPDPERKQILDYLFKPQFGASLNELKVEVGGDINSTEGSEPSHMHTRTDENYTRGFEWWLMEQAKDRNPNIVLDCLAWGAPGWVGNGTYWSTDMMDYYIKFIKGAKRFHGLDIASVGGKNESGYNVDWYKKFRKALNNNGLSAVKLVASDDWGPPWLNIAEEALKDADLRNSIDAFGGHVTWSENPAVASPAILNMDKPLWDTELHNYIGGTQPGRNGFQSEINLVEAFNTNYIKTKITKDITWNLIWSYYPVSSYPDVGLMRANSPWSGHYEISPALWGFAHVNQFVKIGWRFLDGNGCGILPAGGNYTTLKAPNGADYSIIAQTKGATTPQTIRFTLMSGLSLRPVHVWVSTAENKFVHTENIKPIDGSFDVSLAPESVVTITTTTGQKKGTYPQSPPAHELALPYSDNYQSYRIAAQPRYHYDYVGSFEIAKKTVGRGKCLRQAATNSASGWGGSYLPLTFLGSTEWKNYTVNADAYIETAGAVSLHGRIGVIPGGNNDDPPGYTFRIHDTGAWELKSYKTIIASGSTPFTANQWHSLQLRMADKTITASVDGKPVVTVTDGTYATGLAGLGTGWNFAQFSNLKIEPI